MTSVVLVHGTGVREDGYTALFDRVSGHLSKLNRDLTLVRCFWGEEHGARLNRDGSSLPARPDKADARAPAPLTEDMRLASWALLDADPFAELYLLAEEDERRVEKYVPLEETPAEELCPRLQDLANHPTVVDTAAAHGLLIREMVDAAHEVSDILATTLRETTSPLSTVRQVAARAVVAAALASADQRWDAAGASVDGSAVDALLEVVLSALGEPGAALGIVSDVTRPVWLPLWRSAEWTASWRVRRRRSDLSRQAAPPIGDILRYQARGEGLRRHISEVLRAASPPVVVLAHSLGGVACVDLLATEDHRKLVKALVTVGSQAPFLYELDALSSLSFGDALPSFFPERWINVYDPRDPLAYVGAGVFGANRVTDVPFNTRRPLLRAHSAYWDHAPFYKWLDKEIFDVARD
ncbi:hypothetical protein EJ357_01615 [Streptomyces cyaneochromogenes]|uniref:Uncharacterized protein n=1 Tax=Streptomyces cyaneochromogenes TaxID=2496836 RepID=A0A3S9LZF9_9ACTN|nr:hypothetical protein [Streptomyces cyaneochromogenes]AZQ32313.1 hypothetical protein EJ357_01615 [Streptomyces cyaneochromogenes]